MTKKYLQLVLPVLVLVALVFILILIYQELTSQKRSQQQYYQGQAAQLAHLLSEPVWQFSDGIVNTLLESVQDEPEVRCVSMEFARGLMNGSEIGDCSEVTREHLRSFAAPVLYIHQGEEEQLAEVTLYIQEASVWGAVYREIGYLSALVILLCLALAIATFQAFRKIILRPLERVADSLRHYHQTGERQTVDWHTQDELCYLISEYNASLQRQAESERKAHEARVLAEEALQNLKQAQDGLIQAEKMASLGGLVAGVAHEINTPVGNCLTVATSVEALTIDFKKVLEAGSLKRSQLDQFVAQVEDAGALLNRNLHRTAELVSNFKQVAVDQTSSQRRKFDLKQVVNEVVYTLRPQFKHQTHQIFLEIPEGIAMDSYPGPLGQVISNCVNNALVHAFEDEKPGNIKIQAQLRHENQVQVIVMDDGKGMSPEHLQKAFEPFFTTRLGQGGSGLGLHLVYSIVRGILGGEVHITSTPGQGVALAMNLPLKAPLKSAARGDE
ncbi:sensor histidine kinase [Marinospirillum celere]|uniref:sensor histidine kinase n=1 Tax=Marinospirillum celere TaxID=1122252 RepID=UPI0015A54081|nr:ATP-binding protein [Marinospirillum celere]